MATGLPDSTEAALYTSQSQTDSQSGARRLEEIAASGELMTHPMQDIIDQANEANETVTASKEIALAPQTSLSSASASVPASIPPQASDLTMRQYQMLEIFWDYYLRNDNFPAADWVSDILEIHPNTVFLHIRTLRHKGYLQLSENGPKHKFTAKARRIL